MQYAIPNLASTIILRHCAVDERCHGYSIKQRVQELKRITGKSRAASTAAPHPTPNTRIPDGGGVWSTANWRAPPVGQWDRLKGLRHPFLAFAAKYGVQKRLVAHCEQRSEHPAIGEYTVLQARHTLGNCLGLSETESLLIQDHQPFALNTMSALLRLVEEPDANLVQSLTDGARTGCLAPIPFSGMFFPEEGDSTFHSHQDPSSSLAFLECDGNWWQASSGPATTQLLIDNDIAQGFVYEITGGADEAHLRWPHKVAIGKLNLAVSDSKPSRLVLDSTVPNVNPRSQILERAEIPSLMPITHAMQGYTGISDLVAFSLDVKAAHKRVRTRPAELGLLLFGHLDKLYGYRACHFGAKFSAYWWARVGAFLQRVSHLFLFVEHMGYLFVDDSLWNFDAQAAPLQESALLLFLSSLGVPLSWHKLEFGVAVRWIGWDLAFGLGTVSIPADKRARVHGLLQSSVAAKPSIQRKEFEKGLGLRVWAIWPTPLLRAWLSALYHCLHNDSPQMLSVTRAQLLTALNLNDSLVVSCSSGIFGDRRSGCQGQQLLATVGVGALESGEVR